MRRYLVGSVTVMPVVQLRYLPPPGRFFGQLTEPVPDRYLAPPYVDPDTGGLVIDMGGFVIATPERTILVDLGIGDDKDRPNPVFHHRHDDWPGTLAAAGVRAEDVDTVVFTHLHVDHVGNATRWRDGRWVPTFDRARHLTTQAEWEFWTSPAARAETARLGDYVADSLEPVAAAGLLDLVEPDLRLTPEVRLRPAPGHTPGNVCVEVASGGRRAVFCGDMVHHPVQLSHPDWSTLFCIDQGQAATAREALLAELADTGDWLVPAHFPGSRPCRVGRRDGTYELDPV